MNPRQKQQNNKNQANEILNHTNRAHNTEPYHQRWADKKSAIKAARQLADKYPEDSIFIEWTRTKDGQNGYLNPDGNHSPNGIKWG